MDAILRHPWTPRRLPGKNGAGRRVAHCARGSNEYGKGLRCVPDRDFTAATSLGCPSKRHLPWALCTILAGTMLRPAPFACEWCLQAPVHLTPASPQQSGAAGTRQAAAVLLIRSISPPVMTLVGEAGYAWAYPGYPVPKAALIHYRPDQQRLRRDGRGTGPGQSRSATARIRNTPPGASSSQRRIPPLSVARKAS